MTHVEFRERGNVIRSYIHLPVPMSIKDSILAAALAAVLPFTCVAYANPETEPETPVSYTHL